MTPSGRGAPRGSGGLGATFSTALAFMLGVSLTLNIHSYMTASQTTSTTNEPLLDFPPEDPRGYTTLRQSDPAAGVTPGGNDSKDPVEGSQRLPSPVEPSRSQAVINEREEMNLLEDRDASRSNGPGILRTHDALNAMSIIHASGVPVLRDRVKRNKVDLFSAGHMFEGMEEMLEEKIGAPSYADIRIVTPSLPRTFLMALPPYPTGEDVIGSVIFESGVFTSCESVLFYHLLGKTKAVPPPTPFKVPYPARMPRDPGDPRKYSSSVDGEASGDPSRAPPLVVDVGMNMGYFTLMSATYGARTISIDANPNVLPYVATSVLLNDFSRAIRLIHAGVTNSTQDHISISKEAWALARTEEAGGGEGDGDRITIPAKRLDSILNEDVYIFKMDIEAAEHFAMKGALDFFDRHHVDHIILEVQSDMNWFFELMLKKGYTIFQYGEIYNVPMNSESCWDQFEECFSNCLPRRSPEYDGMTGDFFFTKDEELIAVLDRLEAGGTPDIIHKFREQG